VNIQFVWDEAKRLKNLKDHGLDFLGFLGAVPVSIVHTETDRQIRVISFRQATRREVILLYEIL